MKKLALALIPLCLLVAGCGSGPEPVGSATEAPGANKMPDPPARSRPDLPGMDRGSSNLGGGK